MVNLVVLQCLGTQWLQWHPAGQFHRHLPAVHLLQAVQGFPAVQYYQSLQADRTVQTDLADQDFLYLQYFQMHQ